MTLQEKYLALVKSLAELGSAAVAFSGGVDSVFLAKAASVALGTRAVAFTAVSASYPARERAESMDLAARIGINQKFFETRETDDPVFKKNPADRCYHCKTELYRKLKELAAREGLNAVLDGSNADDTRDYRPGLKALVELGIRSPLKELGFTKAEIREMSRQLDLPTWDKPAFACLSSRFQYGDTITDEKLRKVELAEEFFRDNGFRQFRIRDHGNLVRIEPAKAEIGRFLDPVFRDAVVARLKALGYHYVSLDLEGYRTGSGNEILKSKDA